MEATGPIRIDYHFHLLGSGLEKDFAILLDRSTVLVAPPARSRHDSWTELGFHTCRSCPLDPARHRQCPIAANIAELAGEFASIYSTEEALIRVDCEERSYLRRDSVQQGLRSILGIYMAASGCPNMEILKPMTRFHLPFASMEETVYRHLSRRLVAAFFARGSADSIDLDLEGFRAEYRRVADVNAGMYERIKSIAEGDANRNALIGLYSIGTTMGFEIENGFESLRYLFRPAPPDLPAAP